MRRLSRFITAALLACIALAPFAPSGAFAQTQPNINTYVLRALLRRVVSARPAEFTSAPRGVTPTEPVTPPTVQTPGIPSSPPTIPKGQAIRQPLAQLPGPTSQKLVEQYPKGIEPLNFDDFKKLLFFSSKTISVSLKSLETVTIGQVNELLADNQAKLLGLSLFPGELYLLVPDVSTIEALAALLARIKRNAIVDLALPILKYETGVLPQYQTNKWHWSWMLPETEDQIYNPSRDDVGTAGAANYHLKIIRAPQSWVFADFCERKENADKCPPYAKDSWTSFVLDDGIAAHPELPLYPKGRLLVTSNSDERDHGTPVVGVMAAAHDGTGIEGVSPRGGIIFQSFKSTDESQVQVMLAPIKHFYWINTLRVANMSLGSEVGVRLAELKGRDPATYRALLNAVSPMVRDITLQALRNARFLLKAREGGKNERPFYIVAAALNVPEISDLDANITSGYCGASEFFTRNNDRRFLEASDRVICVGNYDPIAGSIMSADYPNAISAPANYILVPQPGRQSSEKNIPNDYEFTSGASFAAPQVAAAIDYLLTVADSKIAGKMKGIIWDSARVLNGKRVLDVFGAFMLIDQENGKANPKWDRELQRYLVDVNVAGDLDGNPRPGKSIKNRGDGQVDMRDFRAFRDALYQVVTGDLDFPDKSSRSDSSKDLNGDGCVKEGDKKCDIEENVYPRYDFNGDGVLDVARKTKFKGKDWTDLDVLADLWPKKGDVGRNGRPFTDDELTESTNGYSKDELVNLVANPNNLSAGSGDDHMAVRFTADFDELRLTFAPTGWRPMTRKIASDAKPPMVVHTVPANVDVELSAAAYKNGKPAERQVEERCVMKDGKAGVRKRTEKIIFYAEGEKIGKVELPAKLPPATPAADDAYTITPKKDDALGECSSALVVGGPAKDGGDDGGGVAGNCPNFTYSSYTPSGVPANACIVVARAEPNINCAGSCYPTTLMGICSDYDRERGCVPALYCDVIDTCHSGSDPNFGRYIIDPNNILTPEEQARLGVRAE